MNDRSMGQFVHRRNVADFLELDVDHPNLYKFAADEHIDVRIF